MNLPRHTLTSHALSPTFVNAQFHNVQERKSQHRRQKSSDGGTASNNVRLDNGEGSSRGGISDEKESTTVEYTSSSSSMFACATRQGFFIARTHPLKIVARRDFPSSQGGLSHVSLIDDSSLLVLVGGGRVPRFAPNKVVLWDEDAAKIVEVKRLEADTSSSEGTASPAASTLFSLSREEAGGEMSNSRDTMSQPSASQTMSRMSVKSTVEETEKDDVDALMQSEMSKAPDIPDDDDAALTTSVEAAKVFVSASMSSSAYVEDPFGAPIAEAKTPEPSPLPSPLPLPLPSRSKPPSRSTDMPPVSHVVSKGREVAELEFGEAVKGVCVRTFAIADGTAKATTTSATLLVVILNTKVVVFELGTHIPLEQKASDANVDKPRRGIRQRIVVEIRPNLPIGLASMALIERSNCVLLALPGRQTGHVQLLSIALSNTSRTSIRSSIAGASTIIAAHANAISSLTLSHDGRLLCTTSERGTLLRVWSTLSASTQDKSVTNLSTSLVGELRRGSDAAKIWSVSFSPDSLLLAAGSDKGTIHFFNLHPLHQVMLPLPTGSQASTNHLSKKANKYLPPSVQQFAGSIPPSLFPQYLKSQWSFAQFKVPLKVFSSSVAEGSRVAPLPLYSLKGQHGAGDEDVESDASSKEVSLEGGWAGMRGRIDDVRKGEKGIEEGMWLTWIPAASAFEQVTTSSSPTKSSRRRSDKASPFELVAITSSGSYYRIGVSAPDQGPMKLPKSATTVLDMYKEDSSSQQSTVGDKGSASPKADQGDQCWLLEYQRFGMRDEWID